MFSLFISLLFLETGIRLAGLFYKSNNPKNTIANLNQDTIRIMTIGESTTEMGGIHSYSAQLSTALLKLFPKKNFQVINEGYGSTTSDIINAKLDLLLEKHKPHIVTIMVGINDSPVTIAYQGQLSDKVILKLKKFKVYKVVEMLSKLKGFNKGQKKTMHLINNDFFWFGIENQELSKAIFSKKIHSEQNLDPEKYSTLTFKELMTESGTLIAKKKLTESINILKKIISRFPKKATPYCALARLYMQWGKIDKAHSVIKKIKSNALTDKESLFVTALFYTIKQDYKQANLILEGYNNRYLDYPAAILLQAKVLESQDNEKAATTLLEKSLKTINDEVLLVALLNKYEKNHNLEKLSVKLEQALKLYPNNVDLYYFLSRLRTVYGFKEKASAIKINTRSYYSDEVNLNNTCATAWELSDEQKYEQAQELLYEALKKFPENKSSLFQILGINAARKGNESLAKDFFNIANYIDSTQVSPITKFNYTKIVSKIRSYGAIPIALKYAFRSDSHLLALLGSSFNNIQTTDNYKRFKKALLKFKYRELFEDTFACSFGHATALGNKILADEITKQLEKIITPQKI